MQSLGNLLRLKTEQSPLLRSVNAAMIVEIANQILPELIGVKAAENAQVVFFKDRTLTLACLSSVIAQEIKLYEEQYIALLNKKCGQNIVDKIKYLL